MPCFIKGHCGMYPRYHTAILISHLLLLRIRACNGAERHEKQLQLSTKETPFHVMCQTLILFVSYHHIIHHQHVITYNHTSYIITSYIILPTKKASICLFMTSRPPCQCEEQGCFQTCTEHGTRITYRRQASN